MHGVLHTVPSIQFQRCWKSKLVSTGRLVLFILFPLLNGCGTTLYQCYEGEPLPPAEVFWFVEGLGGFKQVGTHEQPVMRARGHIDMPIMIDDKYFVLRMNYWHQKRRIYELTPGKHHFDVYAGLNKTAPLTVEGKAGHTYSILTETWNAGSYMEGGTLWTKTGIRAYRADTTAEEGSPADNADKYKRVQAFPKTYHEHKIAAYHHAHVDFEKGKYSIKLTQNDLVPKTILLKGGQRIIFQKVPVDPEDKQGMVLVKTYNSTMKKLLQKKYGKDIWEK